MTTTFVMVPAHEYEAMRDDLARIRQLLEALQPEPSRHITLAKWAREAGLEIEAARRMARAGNMPPGVEAVKGGAGGWLGLNNPPFGAKTIAVMSN